MAAAEIVRETISALSVLDAQRLLQLCDEAEALARTKSRTAPRDGVEVRALQNTLLELMRTTDANLRLLRELRALRVRGVGSDATPGGVRWVR